MTERDEGRGEVEPGPIQEFPTPANEVLEVHITRRSIWQGIGAILLTLALLWAIQAAGPIVGWLAISFFFSLALEPAVRRIVERRGWRRGAAVGVIYAAGLLFLVLMIAVIIPAIAQVATTIGENGADWLRSIDEFAEDTFGWDLISETGAADIAADTDAAIGGYADQALGAVANVAASTANAIFALVTIAMFTFYLTAAQPQLQKAVLKLFSPTMQQRVGWTWDQAIEQTGGYFYSRLILLVINGLGFYATMVLVGVDPVVAIPLALIGAFISVFIPVVGVYIGGAIPVLFTWATTSITGGLIVIGYAVVYQQIENFWLSPKITADTMSLNSGVSFGAAMVGGALAGPMGAFTALPVAALITSFVSNFTTSYEVVYESEKAASRSRRRKEGEGVTSRLRRRRHKDDAGPDTGLEQSET